MARPESVWKYVRRLRLLDACAVSDALDKLQLRGAVTGLAQHSGDARIAGQVITVKLGTGAPAPPAISAAPPSRPRAPTM